MDVAIAHLEVTIVLYFTGDDRAIYLSTVSAMSVKIDAVHKVKCRMRAILLLRSQVEALRWFEEQLKRDP